MSPLLSPLDELESAIDELMGQVEKYPYRLSRLVNYANDEYPQGNPYKKWHIVYYAWSRRENRIKRKRYYRLDNDLPIDIRLKQARAVMQTIDHKLRMGAVIKEERTKALQRTKAVEALEKIVEIKRNQLRETTIRSYEYTCRRFAKWLRLQKLQSLKINDIKRTHIIAFLDYLTVQGLSNRSRNNNLTNLAILFGEIHKREPKAFVFPPTSHIDKLPTIKRKHRAYSREQMTLIRQAIEEEGDQQLLLFISMIYYLLIRPNELINLRIRNIEWNKERIFIPPHHSKNRQGDYVDIYPPLKKMMLEQRIMDYDEDYYVFGRGRQTPGPLRVGAHLFYERLQRILRKLNLLGRGYDMYSFKHAGACNLYLSGVDIRDIQLQCRHKSMTQTMDYLRDLDLFRKKDYFDRIKSF